MKMNPITKPLNTISKPCSLPRDIVLVTELATDIVYNQWGCFDMNRVGNCNPLILFFSNNTTQLRSTPPHKVHALNGLRDMAMNTVTYMTKNAIGTTTLNQLVGGSNPPRPIHSTAIQGFTLDRFLDRQENHLEVSRSQIKDSQAEQERKELHPELEQLTKNQLFLREKFYQRNRNSMNNRHPKIK